MSKHLRPSHPIVATYPNQNFIAFNSMQLPIKSSLGTILYGRLDLIHYSLAMTCLDISMSQSLVYFYADN